MKVELMYDDEREILGITDHEAGISWYTVGRNCDKIICYKESGIIGLVAYFAIYKNKNLIGRRPAIGLTVIYELD